MQWGAKCWVMYIGDHEFKINKCVLGYGPDSYAVQHSHPHQDTQVHWLFISNVFANCCFITRGLWVVHRAIPTWVGRLLRSLPIL